MLSLNASDMATVTVAAEMLSDALEDRAYAKDNPDMSADKLEALGRLGHGFVLTGAELPTADAEKLLREVVRTEIEHWVPNSSQRLIDRASRALGYEPLIDPMITPDHGPLPQDHALIMDWVLGLYVGRCVTCGHMFKV